MSEVESILITFFDINGEYRQDITVDKQKNFLLLENPMRILDQYLNEKISLDIKKETEDQFIVRYKFSHEIQNKSFISINCDIINNFSVCHQNTLDSNGYIVFCNLESKSTLELLDKIVDYIRENCSINVKTYIIGLFTENIDEDKSYNNMQSFLSSLDFEYEYYEMYIGNKDKIAFINQEYENAQIMDDVFKNIFKDIYLHGKGPRFINQNKNKNMKLKDGIEYNSMAKCNIF